MIVLPPPSINVPDASTALDTTLTNEGFSKTGNLEADSFFQQLAVLTNPSEKPEAAGQPIAEPKTENLDEDSGDLVSQESEEANIEFPELPSSTTNEHEQAPLKGSPTDNKPAFINPASAGLPREAAQQIEMASLLNIVPTMSATVPFSPDASDVLQNDWSRDQGMLPMQRQDSVRSPVEERRNITAEVGQDLNSLGKSAIVTATGNETAKVVSNLANTTDISESEIEGSESKTNPQKPDSFATSSLSQASLPKVELRESVAPKFVQTIFDVVPPQESRSKTAQTPPTVHVLKGQSLEYTQVPQVASIPTENASFDINSLATQPTESTDHSSFSVTEQLSARPLSQSTVTVQQAVSNFLPKVMPPNNLQAMSDALISLNDTGGQIDVSLAPEELGKLTIKLDQGSHGPVFTLSAERAETQDMIKRQLEHLQEQLKSLGFENATFSFQEHASNAETGGIAENENHDDFQVSQTTGTQQTYSFAPESGLDIRI